MKRVVGILAVLLLTSVMMFSQADLQPIANVKLLKTEPITIKQLKSRVEAYQRELGRLMSLDEKKKVLDTIINERLVVQAAEKEGIKIPDSEVNKNFQDMVSQQVGQAVTEVEFIQLIKTQTGMTIDDFMKSQNGMTLTEYKAFLRSQILAQRYVMLKKQKEIASITGPTDSDIRKYYELSKQNFVQPDMVRIFLVVVSKGADANAKINAKKKIDELYSQVKEKPSAVAEVKIKSQAANSGYQSGDLYINKNSTASDQLGISMESLLKLFEMNTNEVSDVIETADDYQFFVSLEQFPAKILAISDVVKPGTTVTVYEYIKNNMLSQAQNEALGAALASVINELRTPENFQILRSDAELDKILTW